MRERLITPAAPPLTVAEAETHLRIDAGQDTATLTALLAAATAHVERALGRVYGEQTWEAVFNAFPDDAIVLGKVPVQEVVSITYIDADGAEQTVDPAGYEIEDASLCGRVLKAAEADWPTAKTTANAVVVRYIAGDDEWPVDVKQAILLIVGHWYEYREAAYDRALPEIPFGANVLLGLHWRPFV
jgi:uncharacterized phiE125 gp8 family phage protein